MNRTKYLLQNTVLFGLGSIGTKLIQRFYWFLFIPMHYQNLNMYNRPHIYNLHGNDAICLYEYS